MSPRVSSSPGRGNPSNPRLRGRGALAIDQTPPRGPASPELVAGSQESRVAPVALGPRSGRSLEGTGPAGAPTPTTSPAGVLGRPQIDDNLLEWLVRSRPRRSRGGVPRWSTGAPRATGSDPLVSVGTAGRRDFDPSHPRPRVVVAVSFSNNQSHMRKRPVGVNLRRRTTCGTRAKRRAQKQAQIGFRRGQSGGSGADAER